MLQNERRFRNLQRGVPYPSIIASRSNAVSSGHSIIGRLSGSWAPGESAGPIIRDTQFEAMTHYSRRSSRTMPSLHSISDQNHSPLTSSTPPPVERHDTPQTLRLQCTKRFPSRIQFDGFVTMCSREESTSSHYAMFNHREQQRRIYVQDAKVNNERIKRDGIRFFFTMAGSDFKRGENLRVEELGLLAQIPRAGLDAWLSNTYHESTRPLSMDAADWTDWTPPLCPWTTWRAS